VHFDWDASGREYPNLVLFMIYDDSVAQSTIQSGFRDPVPAAGESGSHVISGATWADLAQGIDERLRAIAPRTGGVALAPEFLTNLGATVARFNEFATAGCDEDFGRGESPIQLAWGAGNRGMPNPTMHPFRSEGPYHCILLGGGSLDTKGGPRINDRAQVLAVDGTPIPGLYGAGNCIASPAGQAYWSPGGTIGPAMVTGYLAGTAAAAEPDKKA